MADEPPSAHPLITAERIELGATVVMAIAAVLTAWAAFQATKWSGVQANSYSAAAAARTESAKFTSVSLTETNIDVETFLAWLDAFVQDRDAGLIDTNDPYVPDETLLSGFIATRFREEFRPAFDAWIESRPLINDEAAGTPFQLPEYELASTAEIERLEAEAEALSAEARRANQRGDNYVLLTVLFAMALFFGGISGRLSDVRNAGAALVAAILAVVVGLGFMVSFPIEI
jgi:hypothetical protein